MSAQNQTIGQRLSQLSQANKKKWEQIDELTKPCLDETQRRANSYKVSLLEGTYENYAKLGHNDVTVWNNPYDEEGELWFKKVQSAYGSFEDTWLEVHRLTNNASPSGSCDTLLVTLNWA